MALKKSIQEQVNRGRERLLRLQRRLLAIPALRVGYNTVRGFTENEGSTQAAAVSYYSILALFPLLLGIIALLGLFLPSETVQRQLFDFVGRNLPASVDLLERNITGVIQLRGTLGIISIIGLLWSGSALFGTISRAINNTCDINTKRPFWIQTVRQIAMAAVAGILLILSMGANMAFTFLRGVGAPTLADWSSRALGFLLVLLIFFLMYKYVPNMQTSWRFVWPGALLGAVLFEIARSAFVIYIARLANYQLIYGSVASVIALFVWAYFSSIIVIMGAEFCSEMKRYASREPD